MASLEVFRNHIIEAPDVFDPEGVHHEFVSGMHGRKLDFGAIPTDSDLFREWVNISAASIHRLYAGTTLGTHVLLSVANGTNDLVTPVTDVLYEEYDEKWDPLETEKISPKAVALTDESAQFFERYNPDFVLALEDAATRGTTSASAILAAREAGARRVEALNTWQRRPQLEELVGIGAVYYSIIHEDLPTLTPDECSASGYCAEGWRLIPH